MVDMRQYKDIAVLGPEQTFFSAYILAGGQSSRMGVDKALLRLAGKPLIEHAVIKARRCTKLVSILSANTKLAAYAPLVHDLRPDTGPIGGIEAALLHSSTDWNLILPVDVPFIPTLILFSWIRYVVESSWLGNTRIALFTAFGRPQPSLLMIHKDAAPYISEAIDRRTYKLYPVLQHAADELAWQKKIDSMRVLSEFPVENFFDVGHTAYSYPYRSWLEATAARPESKKFWFLNVNTQEDFADAEGFVDVLDT